MGIIETILFGRELDDRGTSSKYRAKSVSDITSHLRAMLQEEVEFTKSKLVVGKIARKGSTDTVQVIMGNIAVIECDRDEHEPIRPPSENSSLTMAGLVKSVQLIEPLKQSRKVHILSKETALDAIHASAGGRGDRIRAEHVVASERDGEVVRSMMSGDAVNPPGVLPSVGDRIDREESLNNADRNPCMNRSRRAERNALCSSVTLNSGNCPLPFGTQAGQPAAKATEWSIRSRYSDQRDSVSVSASFFYGSPEPVIDAMHFWGGTGKAWIAGRNNGARSLIGGYRENYN